MSPYTIIIIIGVWIAILIMSISVHQHQIRKQINIEKKLTEHIDRLRKDAFIKNKDFDAIAKKWLLINQILWYTTNRPAMKQEAVNLASEEAISTIDKEYGTYKKTSTYARITSTIANICSLGLYRILA